MTLFLPIVCATLYAAAAAPLPTGRSVVSVIPIERRCPNNRNFQLLPENNDVCVSRDVESPELICQPGSHLDNGQCYMEEFFAPERICPPGSKFNGNECEQTKIASATMTCEAGDQLIAGECVKVESQLAKPSCAKGYHMSTTGTGRCEATTYTTPEFVCPAGFVANGRNCERLAQKVPQAQCPSGSFLHDNVCVSAVLEGQASRRCASGGEMDAQGRCMSVAMVDPDVVCPPGFAFTSGRCEKPVFNAPKYKCPKDFVLQGNSCIQSIPAEPYCSSDEKLTAAGTCVGLQQRDPTRACPQRSVPGPDGHCVVQVVYENDLELACGDRYALVDGRCLKKVKTTDVLQCPAGFELNKTSKLCELRESTVSEAHCAGKASTFDEELGTCVSIMSSDVLITCPRGTDFNPDTSQCLSKKTYTPQYTCPPNMSLKKVPGRSSSPLMECTQHSVTPAQTSCSGMGDLHPSKNQCFRTLVHAPERRCKYAGFTLEDDECVRVETVPATKACPEGFKHVGNACVGKVPTPEHDGQLSNDDRQALQEALEGMSIKRAPSSLRRASEKDRDAALLSLVELANSAKITPQMTRNLNSRNVKQKQAPSAE